MTQRAALRWTVSILLTLVSVCGLHTGEAYSSWGLTEVLICCLTYISTYVAQCHISFGGHILDMMIPFQVMANFQPKVFCMVYCL